MLENIPSNNFFELVSSATRIEELILDHLGDPRPDAEAMVTNILQALIKKTDACAFVLTRMENSAEEWKAKAKKYAEVGKQLDNAAERLRGYIRTAIELNGHTEVSGDDWKFKLCRAKEKLEVNADALSPEWKMVVTETVVDREKLTKALKAGEIIEGAQLLPSFALRVYPNKEGKKS